MGDLFVDSLKRIRTSIRRYRLKRLILRQDLCRIVVGASGIYDRGWIATDIDTLNLLKKADWEHYFSQPMIGAILAEHVWEHLSSDDGILAVKNCFDYLSSGSYLRVAVPDGFHPNQDYIDRVRPGGTGPGAADHKVLYTYQSFTNIFEAAGFTVELLEYFDEQGHFHFKDWDPNDGMIRRSKRFDQRNSDGMLHYTSVILDARKI